VSDKGRLIIDGARCRGCRSCQLACSFARTREYSASGACIVIERDLRTEQTSPLIHMQCCDLCGGDPACASACTYGAILFDRDAPSAIEYRKGDPE
jgi:Fe-S-cluster-containing dehydrogenase component